MLVLGFDFGIKYIGVAVGQTITKTATPVTSICVDNKNINKWSNVFKCIYDWSPSVIIVGYPLNDNFDNSFILKSINVFINDIKLKFNIPVYIVDENLSTWEAKKLIFYKKKKKCFFSINAMSAAILVEQWLFDVDF